MTQTVFRQALLDPTRDVPAGLSDAEGRPAGKRFSVYRNNVAVSLVEALEAGFPATARLLGEGNFKHIAQGYLRANPPSSPLMMLYGGRFPAYIAQIPSLNKLGYLPDVARLEYAMRQSYHAADATPVAPTALSDLPPEALNSARLQFSAAVKLVMSDWPIHYIRDKALSPETAVPSDVAQPVLVTRPEFDPVLTPLTTADAHLMLDLLKGTPLAQAMTQTQDADLGQLLGLLLSQNALTGIQLETPQ